MNFFFIEFDYTAPEPDLSHHHSQARVPHLPPPPTPAMTQLSSQGRARCSTCRPPHRSPPLSRRTLSHRQIPCPISRVCIFRFSSIFQYVPFLLIFMWIDFVSEFGEGMPPINKIWKVCCSLNHTSQRSSKQRTFWQSDQKWKFAKFKKNSLSVDNVWKLSFLSHSQQSCWNYSVIV